MKLVTVLALKDFEMEGRHVYAGEEVTMQAIHAAVRAQSQEVSLLHQTGRSTYQTRDMTATPVAAPTSEEPQKTKRRYRRRTVKA